MAFEGLSSRLQEITRKLRGKARISESDLKEMLREVKLALLEADVNYKIVKEFSILLFCSVAVAVLGNLVFKRMALFKTLLVTFVITSLYCILVTNQWFKEIIESADFNTELSNFVFISRIIYTCISIVLYIVAYYRIKKIQAI